MFVNDYHEEATGQPYGWPVEYYYLFKMFINMIKGKADSVIPA